MARFLDLAAFYSKFINNFSSITHLLNKLKCKGAVFEWEPEQEQAFQTLKSKLTSNFILGRPEFSKQFIVHFNASGSALGISL